MKLIRNLIIVMLVVLLVGCGSDDSNTEVVTTKDNTTEEVTTEEPEAEEQAKEEETASELGKRSNPVPFGQTASFANNYYTENGDEIEATVSVTLSNLVRGEEAYNYLITANEYNEAAPDGYEWAIFDVKLTLDKGSADDSYYVSPSFIPIDSSGSQVNQQDLYATFSDAESFGYIDIYEGGEATGKIGMLLPVGDDDVLVEFSDWNASVFFSLK